MKKFTLMILILIVLPIFLQIYLSKRENKYLGLILPTLFFLFSFGAILNYAYFPSAPNEEFSVREILPMIIGFLYANIPSAIHLIIYIVCRESIKKKNEINKMNIKDL